jgi:hypothetical protein
MKILFKRVYIAFLITRRCTKREEEREGQKEPFLGASMPSPVPSPRVHVSQQRAECFTEATSC